MLGCEGDSNTGVGSRGGVVAVSACMYFGCGGGGRLGTGSGRMGWCYVCVSCESRFSVLMAGPGICMLYILGAPSVQSCCTLSISSSKLVFVCGRYRKSRLPCVW